MINLANIEFNGTQKQNDYARSIRAEAAELVNAAVEKSGRSFDSQQQSIMDKMFSEVDVKFWIERADSRQNPNTWFRAAMQFSK